MADQKAETASAPLSLLLHDQICFAIYSTAHAIARQYKPQLDRLGLTYPQYLCLLVLWEEDHRTVTMIGQQLQLESGTLSPLLRRLEGAGLIARSRDASDERCVRISLTEAGSALREQALPIPDRMLCQMGAAPAELDRLKRDLERLRDALNAAP